MPVTAGLADVEKGRERERARARPLAAACRWLPSRHARVYEWADRVSARRAASGSGPGAPLMPRRPAGAHLSHRSARSRLVQLDLAPVTGGGGYESGWCAAATHLTHLTKQSSKMIANRSTFLFPLLLRISGEGGVDAADQRLASGCVEFFCTGVEPQLSRCAGQVRVAGLCRSWVARLCLC